MPEAISHKAGAAHVGLCLTCLHAKRVETPRSVFWMCGRSATDARYPKYPRLPVLACEGYESTKAAGSSEET